MASSYASKLIDLKDTAEVKEKLDKNLADIRSSPPSELVNFVGRLLNSLPDEKLLSDSQDDKLDKIALDQVMAFNEDPVPIHRIRYQRDRLLTMATENLLDENGHVNSKLIASLGLEEIEKKLGKENMATAVVSSFMINMSERISMAIGKANVKKVEKMNPDAGNEFLDKRARKLNLLMKEYKDRNEIIQDFINKKLFADQLKMLTHLELKNLVSSSINTAPDSSSRVHRLDFWLQICAICKETNNPAYISIRIELQLAWKNEINQHPSLKNLLAEIDKSQYQGEPRKSSGEKKTDEKQLQAVIRLTQEQIHQHIGRTAVTALNDIQALTELVKTARTELEKVPKSTPFVLRFWSTRKEAVHMLVNKLFKMLENGAPIIAIQKLMKEEITPAMQKLNQKKQLSTEEKQNIANLQNTIEEMKATCHSLTSRGQTKVRVQPSVAIHQPQPRTSK